MYSPWKQTRHGHCPIDTHTHTYLRQFEHVLLAINDLNLTGLEEGTSSFWMFPDGRAYRCPLSNITRV